MNREESRKIKTNEEQAKESRRIKTNQDKSRLIKTNK